MYAINLAYTVGFFYGPYCWIMFRGHYVQSPDPECESYPDANANTGDIRYPSSR